MPTPTKPSDLLVLEGRSHRTQAELQQRRQAEDALLTGRHMQSSPLVKDDPVAKKEFGRIKGLLKKIGKDDALYQGPVNRLALLYSECTKIEQDIRDCDEDLEVAETAYHDSQIKADKYLDLKEGIRKSKNALEKMKNTKERMQLQIEKEMALTLAAALRSIPKKVEPKKEESKWNQYKKRAKGSG